MRYWNCYRCGRRIPFDGKIKVIDGQVYHPSCQAKSPADLAQPGASAERISSVVRSNATDGWIKVSERLPKKNGRYLVFCPLNSGSHIDIYGYHVGDYENCGWIKNATIRKDATHWMLLPETPEV